MFFVWLPGMCPEWNLKQNSIFGGVFSQKKLKQTEADGSKSANLEDNLHPCPATRTLLIRQLNTKLMKRWWIGFTWRFFEVQTYFLGRCFKRSVAFFLGSKFPNHCILDFGPFESFQFEVTSKWSEMMDGYGLSDGWYLKVYHETSYHYNRANLLLGIHMPIINSSVNYRWPYMFVHRLRAFKIHLCFRDQSFSVVFAGIYICI